MRPFTIHKGVVAAMDRANVDTDQIIPKQFLKRIERTGFGEFLFFDWRFGDDKSLNPNFELNQPKAEGASILLARQNFGSGSSREHAVWALDDYGIRALIAPSFADIFYNNCFKNGILPVVLPESDVEMLMQLAAAGPVELTVDLHACEVTGPDGFKATFEINPSHRQNLREGLDDISQTLKHEEAISRYEENHVLPSI
jgi:3-isopropylmalate/(R)-2-methylmalate dehydratase small subunit